MALTLLQSCALFSAAGLSSQGQPTKKVTSLNTSYSIPEIVDHSAWFEEFPAYA